MNLLALIPGLILGAGVALIVSALMPRQPHLAATLDRLEARDRRFDQLAQEVADLRRVIESQPSPAPAVETPKRSPWSPYLPYVIAVAVVVVAILAIALVVALLR